MAGYQDQNVSISPQQIEMGGNVFPPEMVSSISIHDASLQHRVMMYLCASGAVLLALFLSGQRGAGNGVLVMLAVAGFFGLLAFWHMKYPNLELRVLLHSGGVSLGSHDLDYLRKIERELKSVVYR